MTKSKWLKATMGLTLVTVLSGNVFGQIWSEDFSYPDGTMDPGNGKWSVDVSAANITASSDWFQVQNNLMEARDTDGPVIWTSQSIDISGESNVSITIDVSESGNHEATDSVNVYYKLDDGTMTVFETNGINVDDFTSVVASHDSLNGDSLRVVVLCWNNAGSEFLRFDNVVINSASANQAPVIANVAKNPTIPTSSDIVTVSADITDDATLTTASSSIQLFYDSGSGFTSTTMINSSGNTFDGAIPPQSNGTVVKYYVSATDIDGVTTLEPPGAPADFEIYQVNNAGTPTTLVVNEILYNSGGDPEFIEIFNNSGASVNLGWWTIGDGTGSFTFPTGTTINNNDFLVVCQDTTQFKLDNPSVTNYVGDYQFGLSSGGESVIITDPNGFVSDQVDYENGTNSWPNTTSGFSIELIDPTSDNNQGSSWKLSDSAGGSPGAATSADLVAPNLVSASAIAATSVDVVFDENVDQATAETLSNYSVDNGIGNPTAATLDATDNTLVHLTVPTLSGGVNYTISVNGVQDISGNPMSLQTDSFTYVVPPNVDDVIVNEIMYNTPSVDEEWLELYNTTGSPIVLTNNWTINSTNPSWSYNFNGETIPANGFLTIQVGSSGSFPFTPDVVFSSSSNQLVNSSSTLSVKFLTITVDEVTYDDGSPWPSSADGSGPSLELNDPSLDNDDGNNWSASANAGGTPGAQNSTLATGAPNPVSISVAVSGNDIILTWSASTGATAYDVYRRTSPDFGTPPSPTELVAGDVAGVSYVDSGAATSGVTFYYVVVAKN